MEMEMACFHWKMKFCPHCRRISNNSSRTGSLEMHSRSYVIAHSVLFLDFLLFENFIFDLTKKFWNTDWVTGSARVTNKQKPDRQPPNKSIALFCSCFVLILTVVVAWRRNRWASAYWFCWMVSYGTPSSLHLSQLMTWLLTQSPIGLQFSSNPVYPLTVLSYTAIYYVDFGPRKSISINLSMTIN